MGGQVIRLPSRFPVGTRYVIEGCEGLIRLRYLEFPDGRKVDLPADLAGRTKAPGATPGEPRGNRVRIEALNRHVGWRAPQPPNPSPIRRKTLDRPGTRVFFFVLHVSGSG
jgi:hypothetical protein